MHSCNASPQCREEGAAERVEECRIERGAEGMGMGMGVRGGGVIGGRGVQGHILQQVPS